MLKPVFCFILILTVFISCKQETEIVPEIYQPRNTHEAYEIALDQAGLLNAALGEDWKDAARNALKKPLKVELPFAEDFYVSSTEAKAGGYRFEVKRGHKIEVKVERDNKDEFEIFLDAFRIIDDSTDQYLHIASAGKNELYLEFEPRADGEYIVRFQTELLRGGIFNIQIQKVPALAFPVVGKDKSAIGSLFGAPRDGGRRKHHGVDIFAKRHTPIVAPTEGRIRFVGERGLGGKVVWMRDTKRNQTLYFAHLHDILIEDDVYVYPGDTLGTVGNTGNARTTPPHLHFGIYKDGPIDPYHFIANTRSRFKRQLAKDKFIGKTVRARKDSKLKVEGLVRRSKSIPIPKFQIMQTIGASAAYYKVRLPDDTIGYIAYDDIQLADRPLKRQIANGSENLLSDPAISAIPIEEIPQGEEIKVLGANAEYEFVERSNGSKGWMMSAGGG